jgi:hypothetical protein
MGGEYCNQEFDDIYDILGPSLPDTEDFCPGYILQQQILLNPKSLYLPYVWKIPFSRTLFLSDTNRNTHSLSLFQFTIFSLVGVELVTNCLLFLLSFCSEQCCGALATWRDLRYDLFIRLTA